MAMVYKYGKMEQNIEALGRTIRHMVKVHFGTQMEIFMKESSVTINQMDMEYFIASMAQYMKVSGLMISSTDQDRLTGQTAQATSATIRKVGDMALELTSGLMAIRIAVSGLITQ